MTPRLINGAGEGDKKSPSPIVDHEVLDPLELAHLDGSPTMKRDFANGSFASFEGSSSRHSLALQYLSQRARSDILHRRKMANIFGRSPQVKVLISACEPRMYWRGAGDCFRQCAGLSGSSSPQANGQISGGRARVGPLQGAREALVSESV